MDADGCGWKRDLPPAGKTGIRVAAPEVRGCGTDLVVKVKIKIANNRIGSTI